MTQDEEPATTSMTDSPAPPRDDPDAIRARIQSGLRAQRGQAASIIRFWRDVALVQRRRLWERWGYKSFYLYCREELDLKTRRYIRDRLAIGELPLTRYEGCALGVDALLLLCDRTAAEQEAVASACREDAELGQAVVLRALAALPQVKDAKQRPQRLRAWLLGEAPIPTTRDRKGEKATVEPPPGPQMRWANDVAQGMVDNLAQWPVLVPELLERLRCGDALCEGLRSQLRALLLGHPGALVALYGVLGLPPGPVAPPGGGGEGGGRDSGTNDRRGQARTESRNGDGAGADGDDDGDDDDGGDDGEDGNEGEDLDDGTGGNDGDDRNEGAPDAPKPVATPEASTDPAKAEAGAALVKPEASAEPVVRTAPAGPTPPAPTDPAPPPAPLVVARRPDLWRRGDIAIPVPYPSYVQPGGPPPSALDRLACGVIALTTTAQRAAALVCQLRRTARHELDPVLAVVFSMTTNEASSSPWLVLPAPLLRSAASTHHTECGALRRRDQRGASGTPAHFDSSSYVLTFLDRSALTTLAPLPY